LTKSIEIFEDIDKCIQLFDVLNEKSAMLSEAILIPPISEKISSDETELLNAKANILFKSQNFEDIRILNPKLDRKIRQKDMSRWLMPFGFIAGIAFSNMTNLSTFNFLGLNNIGESLIGGLLGMGSGYLGSIVSSASININRNKERYFELFPISGLKFLIPREVFILNKNLDAISALIILEDYCKMKFTFNQNVDFKTWLK